MSKKKNTPYGVNLTVQANLATLIRIRISKSEYGYKMLVTKN